MCVQNLGGELLKWKYLYVFVVKRVEGRLGLSDLLVGVSSAMELLIAQIASNYLPAPSPGHLA